MNENKMENSFFTYGIQRMEHKTKIAILLLLLNYPFS